MMMEPDKINELIALKLFGVKKVYYPDAYHEKSTGGTWPYYIPSGKPWRTHHIDAIPLPRFAQSIGAVFQAVDKLIDMGFRRFRLEHICCVDNFSWAASISGLWDSVTTEKPEYGGAGKTRVEAICSMIIKILETP
jgi:hypothetical protein